MISRLKDSAFLRFLVVGGALALAQSLLATGFTLYLPGPRPLLAVLATLILLWPAYQLQARVTFKMRGSGRRGGLSLYAATQAVGMAITAFASWRFTSGLSWADTLVYLTASAVAAVISYLMAKLVIFRP